MALCGYRTGVITDRSRSNWHNNADRLIAWSAWYPTEDAESADKPSGHFFELGNVIRNAALTPGGTLPVVLLSHGTGGTAESIGWIARTFARKGYVVLGANHHGNTGVEPYLAEGFLCWWERATDLSALLTSLGNAGLFANRLAFDDVSAVGFSLGAFAAPSIAQIKIPVTILTGGDDQEAPAKHCADWLMKLNQSFQRHDQGQRVGHYTFLDLPSDKSLVGNVDIFSDHETVDRLAVHRKAAKIMVDAFG